VRVVCEAPEHNPPSNLSKSFRPLTAYLIYKSVSSFFSWPNLKIKSLYFTKMWIIRFIFGQSFASPITA